MSEIVAKWGEMRKEADDIEQIKRKIVQLKERLDNVKVSVNHMECMGRYHNLGRVLGNNISSLEKQKNFVTMLETVLNNAADAYQRTEQELSNAEVFSSVQSSKNTQSSKQADLSSSTFGNHFKDNFWSSLRDAALESSGGTLVRVGGIINVKTALAYSGGANGFVIVNPNVANKTSKLISIGTKAPTVFKYGLPALGAVFDYRSLRKENAVGESVIKAGAHLGIGIAGGEAGAALGAAAGSVIPVAGTAVGAAVGFVAGVAITTVGNMTFDYVYDNFDKIKEGTKKVADNIVTGVKKIGDSIGDAISGAGNFLGSVFG